MSEAEFSELGTKVQQSGLPKNLTDLLMQDLLIERAMTKLEEQEQKKEP